MGCLRRGPDQALCAGRRSGCNSASGRSTWCAQRARMLRPLIPSLSATSVLLLGAPTALLPLALEIAGSAAVVLSPPVIMRDRWCVGGGSWGVSRPHSPARAWPASSHTSATHSAVSSSWVSGLVPGCAGGGAAVAAPGGPVDATAPYASCSPTPLAPVLMLALG